MNHLSKHIILSLQILCSLVVVVFGILSLLGADISPKILFDAGSAGTQELMIMGSILHALLVVSFGVLFFLVFKKASYPEVLFIMLSSLMFACMDLRILVPGFGPYRLQTIGLIQKVLYFFWIFSSMLLFTSGLFHNGIPYLKQSNFMIITFCAATLIVYLLPISRTEEVFTIDQIHILVRIIVYLLQLFAILNYIIAASRNNNSLFILIAVGMLLFILGNDLFFFSPSLLIISVGILSYITGAALLIRTFYHLHLWS